MPNYFCSVDGCTKYAQRCGICVSHGARVKRCEFEGCEKYAQQGGRCVSHGAKVKSCKVEDCNKKAQQGGLCVSHGARIRTKNSRHDLIAPKAFDLEDAVSSLSAARPISFEYGGGYNIGTPDLSAHIMRGPSQPHLSPQKQYRPSISYSEGNRLHLGYTSSSSSNSGESSQRSWEHKRLSSSFAEGCSSRKRRREADQAKAHSRAAQSIQRERVKPLFDNPSTGLSLGDLARARETVDSLPSTFYNLESRFEANHGRTVCRKGNDESRYYDRVQNAENWTVKTVDCRKSASLTSLDGGAQASQSPESCGHAYSNARALFSPPADLKHADANRSEICSAKPRSSSVIKPCQAIKCQRYAVSGEQFCAQHTGPTQNAAPECLPSGVIEGSKETLVEPKMCTKTSQGLSFLPYRIPAAEDHYSRESSYINLHQYSTRYHSQSNVGYEAGHQQHPSSWAHHQKSHHYQPRELVTPPSGRKPSPMAWHICAAKTLSDAKASTSIRHPTEDICETHLTLIQADLRRNQKALMRIASPFQTNSAKENFYLLKFIRA